MLFVVQWSGPAAARKTALERVKRLRSEHATAASTGVKVIARWHAIAEPGGYAIVDADDASKLAVWIIQWNDLFAFTLTPVMDAESFDASVGLL